MSLKNTNPDYWSGIKISDIKNISGVGGRYNLNGNGNTHEEFIITMKDGSKNTIHFISQDRTRHGNLARQELKQILNERDNVPEIYYLYTNIYAEINGKPVQVGYEVEDNLNEYRYFTLNEINALEKEFKIGDNGSRSLVYIKVFTIEGNKITKPIEQRWVDQLVSMGYDISKLEYEIEDAIVRS